MRWFGHGRRAQATVTAAPTLEGRPPLRAGAGLRPANSSAGYVVSVGGSPAFTNLDDAERLILDQRWARAGCPRFGRRGQRPT